MHTHGQGAHDADEALQDINAKTGRNMPQAVGTAVLLIAVIVLCLLVRLDAFVALIVIFMSLGLWELRVDFAIIGLRIPLLTLWVCSAVTLFATFYASVPLLAAALCVMATVVLTALSASLDMGMGDRIAAATARKDRHPGARPQDSFGDDSKGFHQYLGNVAVSVLTVLYIPLLASFLVLPLTFNGHPVAHAVMLIFLPAISDTGGLFAGAWLGKHKLSPGISPKKSVEGLLGSILASIIGAYVIFALTYGDMWSTRGWVPVLMGVIVGVVGTLGDLSASLLKRAIGIKDMGHLLKGHGGVLDRVDSILMCAPFLTLLLWATGL